MATYTINVTSHDETSAVIHITNEDAPSTPVSNMEVYVKEGTAWNDTPFAASAKTDANGDATVAGLVPGKTYGIWRQGAATASTTPVTFTTTARDFKIPTAAQWQDLATRVKAAPVITMTSTDPGEGGTLAANNFIAVYNAS